MKRIDKDLLNTVISIVDFDQKFERIMEEKTEDTRADLLDLYLNLESKLYELENHNGYDHVEINERTQGDIYAFDSGEEPYIPDNIVDAWIMKMDMYDDLEFALNKKAYEQIVVDEE